MWVIAVAVVGALIVLTVRAFHNEAEFLQDWEKALSPWGVDTLRELEQRLEGESRMAEYAFGRAFAARASGSPEEAIRMLEVALEIVERTSPEMVALLREMSNASRMAAALSRVDPLPTRGFQLRTLSTLAVGAAVAHQMLFSPTGRFRLRAYVLQRGVQVTTRFLLDSTRRIRLESQANDREWERIAAARADLQTLAVQSLLTFRILVTSLAAQAR
jgi:hypothetical protein